MEARGPCGGVTNYIHFQIEFLKPIFNGYEKHRLKSKVL